MKPALGGVFMYFGGKKKNVRIHAYFYVEGRII
jgi:hypothetical protein